MSLVVSVFTKTTSQKPEMLKKKCFPWDFPVVFSCSLPLKLSFLLSWRCYWEAWRICWCYHYSHLRCLEGFPWIVANINKSRYFIDQNRKFFLSAVFGVYSSFKTRRASVKTKFVTGNMKWLCYDSLDHWSWFDLTTSYWCPRTNVANSAHWESNELEKTELFGQLYCQETWNWKCHIIIGLESAMIKSSHYKKAVLFW